MKKIIILRLKGGLGNQLFMYAAALAFCHKNNLRLLVDGSTGFWADKRYRRVCRLDLFNISSTIFFLKPCLRPVAYWVLKICKAISQASHLNFYIDQSHDDGEIVNNFFLKYIEGYWQSENYFSEYATLIKHEFSFKRVGLNSPTLKDICKFNSVGIHVRFFSEHIMTEPYLAYYKNAIQVINEKVANPVFYIFSDDIAKTKKLFSGLIDKPNFVDGGNSEVDDFLCLSSCKNFIGSDSTFFWWAAWLSDSPNKIVIFPRHLTMPNNFYPVKWLGI